MYIAGIRLGLFANDHKYKKLRNMDPYKKKLRGRSPQANYTDRATAACRRS
jgi:hypothetical protein